MKANFLVIGAQKCATTSLCHLLEQHPQIFVSDPKEPQFFARDPEYQRGGDWYQGLFAGVSAETAIGEGSTTYTMSWLHPLASVRIAAQLPDARLIYIARDPVERIVSHWAHDRSAGRAVPNSLTSALDAWPQLIDNSRYWHQISRYREHYPDDRILVLFFEDFRKEPEAVLARCFGFLGVDPEIRIADAGKNWNPTVAPGIGGKLHRYIPFYRVLRSRISPRARAPFKRWLKPFFRPPSVDDRTRTEIWDRLHDDSRVFLSFYGKPTDFWSR